MQPRRARTHQKIDAEVSLRQSRVVRRDVNEGNPVFEQEISDSGDESTVGREDPRAKGVEGSDRDTNGASTLVESIRSVGRAGTYRHRTYPIH